MVAVERPEFISSEPRVNRTRPHTQHMLDLKIEHLRTYQRQGLHVTADSALEDIRNYATQNRIGKKRLNSALEG